MDDYIVAISIFFCTFVVVCIVYDCILRSRMKRRMRETWEFINSMKVMITAPEEEVPERVPF
jgi:hypothetical protein